jgi:PAB1-binding protein PBP1
VLQKWVPDAPAGTDASLESNGLNSKGASRPWNQFEENERRFGLKSDYDENIYTTTIDKSHPNYRQRLAQADRIAREIEGSTSTNSHIAEERIRDNLTGGGDDEEDK